MMWASLAVGLFTRPWARRAAAIALALLTIALFTIALFILNLRRTAERAGRAVKRLETSERVNAIQHQMLEVASRRPRDRDDLLERLRGGGF